MENQDKPLCQHCGFEIAVAVWRKWITDHSYPGWYLLSLCDHCGCEAEYYGFDYAYEYKDGEFHEPG